MQAVLGIKLLHAMVIEQSQFFCLLYVIRIGCLLSELFCGRVPDHRYLITKFPERFFFYSVCLYSFNVVLQSSNVGGDHKNCRVKQSFISSGVRCRLVNFYFQISRPKEWPDVRRSAGLRGARNNNGASVQ